MVLQFLKKFFLKNFILSLIIFTIIFLSGLVSGFCSIVICIIFSGFTSSIFIREKKLILYMKEGIINSLIFSVLLEIKFIFWILIIDNINQCRILFFVITLSSFFLLNFFGIIGGIIPKCLSEKIF